MTRLFVDCPLQLDTDIALPEDAAHHFIKVLRARVGEAVCLFNGQGGEYYGQLTTVDKRQAIVRLDRFNADDRCSPLAVHLGQVLSRGERMDYAIQKATELGVHTITPLLSERCEVRLGEDRQDKKLQHWQRIAISACEQCGLNRVPTILPPQTLDDWLQGVQAEQKWVLAPAVATTPATLAHKPRTIAVLIGPEGGLSAPEISRANQAGFANWAIGPRILRTETAPVVALSLLHWQYGDLT